MDRNRHIFLWTSLTVLIMLLTTGCWDRQELNQIAIVSGLGIDVGTTPGTVLISAQVIRPGDTGGGDRPGSGGGGRPFGVVTVEAPTLFAAIRKATTLSSRKLFFAHTEVIVFGEEYARQGIRPAIDFLMRDQEVRSGTKVLIATGEAREIMHAVTQFERIPGLELCNLVGASSATSSIGWARLIDVYQSLLSPSTDPIATYVDAVTSATVDRKVVDSGTPVSPIQGDREVRARLVGTAVFKDDKFVGSLDLAASRGYRWIMDEVISGIVQVIMPDGSLVDIEIFTAQSKVKATFSPDGPRIEIQIETTAGFAAQSGPTEVDFPQELKRVEAAYALAITSEIELVLSSAKSLGTDIFGFGSALQRKDPRAWRELKDQWENVFRSLPVETEVKPRITSYGVTVRPPVPKGD